jgi:hypothetical protein
MEISGPKINNFVNLDSELLETGTSAKANQPENVLPIGVEVKKFSPNGEGKNKFDSSLSDSDSPANIGASASSLAKVSEELLVSGNFKLSLDKKKSGEFPKLNNGNNAQSPPGQLKSHGNKHKTDFPSNPSNPVEVKDKVPNNIPNNSNNSSLPNPSLPPPVVRPKANELPQINQNNSDKNNSNNSLETNFNQKNLQQVLNQQTVEKQLLKTENKLDKVFNKDLDNDLNRNTRADKPHPNKSNKPLENSSTTSPASVDEVENTLEIEITQSLEVEQDIENNLSKTDEFPIDNEPVDVDPGQSSRIGKGRGKDNGADVVFNNIDILGNSDSIDNIPNNNDLLDNALSSAVGRFAGKHNPIPTTTIPNVEVLDAENLDLNNPEAINNPNKFVGSKQQVATNLPSSLALSNPANPIDKADVNNANPSSQASLGRSSLLAQQAKTSDANSIANLIAASNTKVLMIPVGQSLEQVASELGMDVFDLLKANPQLLKDPLLFAGQKLKVPNPQDSINLANNLINPNGSLTNSQQPLSGQINSLANQLSTSQLEQKQLQLDPTKANLSAIATTQAELAKANSLPHQSHLRVTEAERGISGVDRASEKATPTVKQNENFAPTFGVFANRDIEEEFVEDRPQSKRKLNLPEPFDEWADYIYSAADKYDLETSLIAAMIWCESAGKNTINGHGHGLMQIDARRYNTWLKVNENGLNPATNIDFGISILRKNIDYFGKIADGIAAYNCGIDLVEEALILGKGVDYFTNDKNYSFRVLTQQDYFRRFFD